MTFKDLRLVDPILKALEAEGYTHPTPIQVQSIPVLLRGKDLLACAQTGTGKTAAFSIPILQHLYLDRRQNNGPRKIKTLIVTPTRELAIQIGESITAYGKFTGIRNTVVFGGVKQAAQVQALKKGIDILVATPGRLLDLMGQGIILLSDIEYFVLDEADRMLDMGFIHDIRKIIAKLPEERQSLFFSATMPPDIVALSRKILGNPEKVAVKPEQTTAEKVEQAVYFVSKKSKFNLLVHLLQTERVDSALVFSRTKHGANKIVKLLKRAGINADAIHGNKSQGARQRALGDFKSGDTNVLVATDIAARGIDVEELSHVINYDLPNIPETYVHRIGRTGRAGASGIALSFCDTEEKAYLRDIQKLINQKIAVVTHPFLDDKVKVVPASPAKPARQPRQPQKESRAKPQNRQQPQQESPAKPEKQKPQPRLKTPAKKGRSQAAGRDKKIKLTEMRLIVWSDKVKETVEFYTKNLGFTSDGHKKDRGWASLRKDKIQIMVSYPDENAVFYKPRFTGAFYFCTDDVDGLWKELETKVKVCFPIDDFDHGMREFAIYDNNGYLLQFGQEIG